MINCTQAKNYSIIDFLKKLNNEPQKIKGNEYWYHSPLRQEITPSFKVNKSKNTWWDYGIHQGGNIIDMAMMIFNDSDISSVLKKIDNHFSFFGQLKNLQQNREVKPQSTSAIELIKTAPLNNTALLEYIAGRKVESATAQQYCREVYYRVNGKNYFAIGFKNDTGGYEIRNKYFKGCIKPKDITTIENGYELLTIFEGFMDFLSYRQLLKGIEYRSFMAGSDEKKLLEKITAKTDFLILNSIIHLKKAEDKIKQYDKLHLFFDNDATGKSSTAAIHKLGIPFEDISACYSHYKDLNDFLKAENQEAEEGLNRSPGLRI